jgi:hypothetical protein
MPKDNPIHPLAGQRVVDIRGPFIGLYGIIRNVGDTAHWNHILGCQIHFATSGPQMFGCYVIVCFYLTLLDEIYRASYILQTGRGGDG